MKLRGIGFQSVVGNDRLRTAELCLQQRIRNNETPIPFASVLARDDVVLRIRLRPRGNGIYQHDCDELLIAHDFVGQSGQDALRMRASKDRIILDRPSTAKRNKILNNVFLGDAMLSISDPENTSDHNVFVTPNRPFDLAAWRDEHGWDRNSVAADVRAIFNPETPQFHASADLLEVAGYNRQEYEKWVRTGGAACPCGMMGRREETDAFVDASATTPHDSRM